MLWRYSLFVQYLVLMRSDLARQRFYRHVRGGKGGITRTCRTAPTVLLRVEDLPRTSLSAGRTRATLIRQAAPSPRAKATIGWRGRWRLYGPLPCMGALRLTSERAQNAPKHSLGGGCAAIVRAARPPSCGRMPQRASACCMRGARQRASQRAARAAARLS
eukprot:COSAG05_NODE_4277_length_1586_cov_1.306658_1_plen_161_part_00